MTISAMANDMDKRAINERVHVRKGDGLATVTLTRPDKHNGVDLDMIDGIRKAARDLRKDRSLRAIIIAGDGPSFCAGLDVKSLLSNKRAIAISFAALCSPTRNRFQDWSMAWRDVPVPVVAVIHGNCFGAGLQLALGADIRIATPDARISIMESKWGLVPDMGGTALLHELLRIDEAKELTMTGRILSGTEAHALGLVTHVSEEPLDHANRIVEEISNRSPDAVAAAKFLLQTSWRTSERSALSAERQLQRRLVGSRNQRIAVRRNTDKAPPAFVPRALG